MIQAASAPAISQPKELGAKLLRLVARPFDLKRPAALEIMILLFICAADMYSTVYWVQTGQAIEANPLLAWTFHLHPAVFVVVKAATFLPTLFLASLLAQRRPDLVTKLLRCVIAAYIIMYLGGVFGLQLQH